MLVLGEAIGQSIAPDGGLYVPEVFPTFNADDFAGLNSWNEIGKRLLEPFFRDDDLQNHLSDICDEAFNFPITLNFLNHETAVLELFHGPTAAFKDVGARFLAACVARMPGRRMIIVATSGDTGGAVAAAFAERRSRPVEEFQHCRGVAEKVQSDRKVERFVTDVQKMILEIIVAKEWFKQALADFVP